VNKKTEPAISQKQQGLAMIEQSLAAAPIGFAVAATAIIGPKLPPFQGD